MKISAEKLAEVAENSGFRAEVLEKVVYLLRLIEALQSHPFLKGKLVLKGTALNLFAFDVPRLSVDVDLNYIGAEDRESMLAERPKIEQAIQAVIAREEFNVRRMPTEEHAGGKWSLRYQSALGQGGNLEVDVNYMFRIPLWPVRTIDSYIVGDWRAIGIPVLDYNELAAGKLVALLARRQARDLFDSHRILQIGNFDLNRLRIAFVVYGAMNRKDWRTVSVKDVDFETTELARQLIPTLRAHESEVQPESVEYGNRLVRECRDDLSIVLPLKDAEREFLNLLLERGEIHASLLTADKTLQQSIESQPLLKWKTLNVRRHKGLT